jgi:ubiquitin-protein ligase
MINFSCPACGKNFIVPDDFAGRAARCTCKQLLNVPDASTAEVAAPPVAAASSPLRAMASLGLRGRRLLADERDMRETFSAGSIGTIISTRGEPPELYVIDLSVGSLVSGSAHEVAGADLHRIEVQLTSDYPRVGPKCRMLTPIFHPNIDAASICIGDHWAAGEKLSDLVLRVAEMLAYQAYNIRSPLNATAAMWADTHPEQLPIDRRDLRARG